MLQLALLLFIAGVLLGPSGAFGAVSGTLFWAAEVCFVVFIVVFVWRDIWSVDQ